MEFRISKKIIKQIAIFALLMCSNLVFSQTVFTEDFGTSPIPTGSNDYGRRTSTYMPVNSFIYGTSKQYSTDNNVVQIDNNHYAVVAPEFIYSGLASTSFFFWTLPTPTTTGTGGAPKPYTQDHTIGDTNGAVMVVNAGTTLNSFYERNVNLQQGSCYRLSFWVYLVNASSQVGVDIKDVVSNNVLQSYTTPWLGIEGVWTQFSVDFKMPTGCASSDIKISLKNILANPQGNDYYIDDIVLEKLSTCTAAPIANCPTGVSYCITGCNSNSYVNSVDPNTIEYDNMVGVYHSSMVREYDGKVKVWGQGVLQNGTGTTGNSLVPQELTAANYGYNTPNELKGTILKFAGASNGFSAQQFAVLTTAGLFVWGDSGTLVPLNDGTNNVSGGNFRKAKVGTFNVNSGATKADGLPAGVNPTDVKMMFGTRDGLAIVTCTGAAWVLSSNGNAYGDGATDNTNNDRVWHRVSTASNTPLNNVVAVRGTYQAFMALTSTGEIYTWGTSYLGDGSNATNRSYATLMQKPVGVTPKMIGMTTSSTGKTYYLLATDGKLFALGNNTSKQLGDGTTNESRSWKQVTPTNIIDGTSYSITDNIVWISPQEHEGGNFASINVLTKDSKLWAWGNNGGGMLGVAVSGPLVASTIDPTYMPGRTNGPYNAGKLNLTDKLIAVETGGHTSLTIKQCTTKFGYVGHKINGSMADGTSADAAVGEYNFSDTSELAICGAVSAPIVNDLKICAGTTANLADATSPILPTGATGINWWTDAAGTIPVSNPASVGPGTYYATYQGLTVKCTTKMTVSYYTSADPQYATCACYNPAYKPGTGPDTKVGITLLKRAGADHTDGWPMARKSGHLALESNTKGFVVTRMTTSQITAIENPQEGMMVYDTDAKCMKVYTEKDGTSIKNWYCMTTPACP